MTRNTLKRRVDTRLAWLGLTHKDFAELIGIDKSSLSRALRAERPRRSTLEKIASGLGIVVEELMDASNHEVLTSDHPAFEEDASVDERQTTFASWLERRHAGA